MNSTQNAAGSGSLRHDAFDAGRTGVIAGLVSWGFSSRPVPSSLDLDTVPADSRLTPELALARIAAGYQ